MDNSELVTYCIQLDSQVYIFNSEELTSEHNMIIFQYPGTVAGENGYCVVYKRDHTLVNTPPNYQCVKKRANINRCIREIYFVNGLVGILQWAPILAVSTPQELWHQVERCLQPMRILIRSSLDRVKRRLFMESKRQRKSNNPKRGNVWGTQVFFFRPMRQKIPKKHVRRGFLTIARRDALHMLLREHLEKQIKYMRPLPRLPFALPYYSVLNAPTDHGIFNDNATTISKICSYHHHKARQQPHVAARLTPGSLRRRKIDACNLTHRAKMLEAMLLHEQVRRLIQTYQIILEESVRSAFYSKQIYRLVEDHEEFVYIDNKILEN